jgi:predicted transcriptional regulator YdeE
MTPAIIVRDEFIVVGIRAVLETDAHTTGTLWKDGFLPRHSEIANSLQVYYGVFNTLPGDEQSGRYEYVAGVASDLENIPVGMVGWVIPGGSYAEAEATGLPGIGQVCRELIANWLPNSGYKKVASPMFAHTTHRQPDSPEAVWKINIPVATPEELEKMDKWNI